jgi:hypothetical protein
MSGNVYLTIVSVIVVAVWLFGLFIAYNYQSIFAPNEAINIVHKHNIPLTPRTSLTSAITSTSLSTSGQALRKARGDMIILSRQRGVEAFCDARGNLGPCNVVVQSTPGTDWLKDRWQAASDMGGTAIPGAHWIVLDFHRTVLISKIVVDWETAHADDYRIEVRRNATHVVDFNSCGWDLLFDNSISPNLNRYAL